MTKITVLGGTSCLSLSARAVIAQYDRNRAVPDDLGNLLQAAASAFHLLDRQVAADLRPLVQVGLSAIRRASVGLYDAPPVTSFLFVTGVPHEQNGR